MSIEAWLRGLGLECYLQAFSDNDIDTNVLPELTADDLTDLGVTSIGHRRILLTAIALLRVRSPSASVSAETGFVPGPSPNASVVDAERRQLTIMFCDLVGSTALSSRLDPEELRDVIGIYYRCVGNVVSRFDGFVSDYMGDGIMAYFGYPRAHEGDAERAVRAGLALVDAIALLNLGLQVRIGVATGVVVVGDLTGSGELQERGVAGEAPNLAARLQTVAAPGTVMVSEATRHLIGTVFELKPMGPQALKGIGGAVAAYRVHGVIPIASRFEAHRAGALAPIVGRDQELALLLDHWRCATNGHAQCVLLIGEAGIGKSRIARALRDAIEGEPNFVIRYQCSPYAVDSALWPAIQQISLAAGFVADDGIGQKLDKLEALLGKAVDDITVATPLLAALLELDAGDRYPPLNLTPQQRRNRLLQTLGEQFVGLAGQRALLLIIEDAHWVDPTTFELIEEALDRLAGCSAFVLITARPPFERFAGQARVETLALKHMDRETCKTMMGTIARGRTLPAEIVDGILAKADGVPLFIEELTRAVLQETDLHHPMASLTAAKIPSTLQESLLARLDRLRPVKRVIQAAACIGREFTYELLAAVTREPEARLRDVLDQLADAELIFRRGAPPTSSYVFKHALIRDAAYQLLLKGQREQMHARIAEVIHERFSETVASQPELVARHYTEARMVEPAIEFWQRAGAQAVGRFANREAISHFEQALLLVAKQPPSSLRDAREMDLSLALSVPLIAAYGFGSKQVEDGATRLRSLADALPGNRSQFAARKVEFSSCLMRGRLPQAVQLATSLLELAKCEADPTKVAIACRALGYSLSMAGQFREAAEMLGRGVTLADNISDAEFATYGEHPGMLGRAYIAQVQALMGFPDVGCRLAREAITHSRKRNNPHSLVWAIINAATTYQLLCNAPAVSQLVAEALELSREHRLPQWLARSREANGWALCRLGACSAGLTMQEEGVRDWFGIGAVLHTSMFHLHLAGSFLIIGNNPEAERHLAAARAHHQYYGENYMAAELHRLEARLLQAEGSGREAVESQLTRAIDVAHQQGARLFELRAATTLAELWAEHGERRRAADLLAPLYAIFTEGFDAQDLRQARVLLKRLT